MNRATTLRKCKVVALFGDGMSSIVLISLATGYWGSITIFTGKLEAPGGLNINDSELPLS